jgi:hypothetical protein
MPAISIAAVVPLGPRPVLIVVAGVAPQSRPTVVISVSVIKVVLEDSPTVQQFIRYWKNGSWVGYVELIWFAGAWTGAGTVLTPGTYALYPDGSYPDTGKIPRP